MSSVNKVIIVGNLSRDPDVKKTSSGRSVANVGVVTNRRYTDSKGSQHIQAEFHAVVCWGKLADIVEQYLKKGMKVYVEGRLVTRSWKDTGGVKHYRTEIIAEQMRMLSPKPETSASATEAEERSTAPLVDSREEIEVEDLPF